MKTNAMEQAPFGAGPVDGGYSLQSLPAYMTCDVLHGHSHDVTPPPVVLDFKIISVIRQAIESNGG